MKGSRDAPAAVVLLAVCLTIFMATPARASFILGDASDYVILFEGTGGNTLQITNVTADGNVGVGDSGQATDSGPSTITGRIDFSAGDTGQFSNNNGSNVITGGVHYNVGAVTSALSTINSLSQTLNGDAGKPVAITGTQTINASDGTLFTVNGQTVHVFNATSFKNGGDDVLTINGSATDLVAINLGGLGNIQFHGGIEFTGGITADNVVFNVGGGDYSTQTGADGLDINNSGGDHGIAQGIFLDPNGKIDVTNAYVEGRVFGGDAHDYQYVSGSYVGTPGEPVPEPGTLALLGTGLAVIGAVFRKNRDRRREAGI